MNPPFDEARAIEQTGGEKAFCVEVVEAFLQELPALVSEVARAMESRDAATLRRAAHTLKGSVDVLAAKPARAAALKLENLAKVAKWEDVPDVVADLKAELERLLLALRTFVDSA